MYAEIEKSGIHVRDGLVAVRFAFYLEPFDPRYSEHYVFVMDEMSKEFLKGYKGKVNEWGQPVDREDYTKWMESLPKVWHNNPFHNHFDLVSADITDAELKALIKKRLADFGKAWSDGWFTEDVLEKTRQIANGCSPSTYNKTITNYDKCVIKGLDIATRAASFERVK